jgi:predicted ribosomally synthesized peptide with nif11-like leader
MSQQNAGKFINLLLSDKALQERTAGMKPEEVLACAREQGLECTLEELKAATLKSRELTPDEMDQAAGGIRSGARKLSTDSSDSSCPNSPDGSHKWVKTAEYLDDTFLFLEHWTVFYTCDYCMATKRKGESDWVW